MAAKEPDEYIERHTTLIEPDGTSRYGAFNRHFDAAIRKRLLQSG